ECHPGTEEVPYTRPGRHQDTLHERRFSHLEPPDAEEAEGDEQHREKDIDERQYQQARPSYPDHQVYPYPRHSPPRNQHRRHHEEGLENEPEFGREEGRPEPSAQEEGRKEPCEGVEFDVDSQKYRAESHPGVLGYPPRHELGVGLREVEGNPLTLCEG